MRADRIKIPGEVKGITLNEQQKKDLAEGKAVYLESMTSKNGKEFNAAVQVNAARHSLEFRFDEANKYEKAQQQSEGQQAGKSQFRIPDKLLGKELSAEQQQKMKEGITIYVEGMTDKAGEKFNAYVKADFEKGKPLFFKWNPDKAQKATPDNNSKTQVAVNSEGKTNEATRDVKEPLKQGQSNPDSRQQLKQQGKKAVKPS